MRKLGHFLALIYGIYNRDLIITALCAWIIYDDFVSELKSAKQPPDESPAPAKPIIALA